MAALRSQIEEREDQTFLKGFELTTKTRRRASQEHLIVSQNRPVDTTQEDIVTTCCNILDERFDVDSEVMEILEPFANLDPAADIKAVHRVLGADIDLAELALEFQDLSKGTLLKDLPLRDKVKKLLTTVEGFDAVATILARILAAKPHSADVERLISASHILTSPHRSSLGLEAENDYLYIHYNMPPVESWDPRPAVLLWLQDKDRRHRETPRAVNQPYFRGIFAEAGDDDVAEKVVIIKKSF